MATTSLPSNEIFVLDVPEVKNFKAEFRYNYYVEDEKISETGSIPAFALQRPASEIDTSFIQYSRSRVPRYVFFTYTATNIKNLNNNVNSAQQNKNAFNNSKQNGSLIRNNLSKIVSEEYFSSINFVGLKFQDTEFFTKTKNLISSSLVQRTSLSNSTSNISDIGSLSSQLLSTLPASIKPHLIEKIFSDSRDEIIIDEKTGAPTKNNFYDDLTKSSVSAQINTKILDKILLRAILDPKNQFAHNLTDAYKQSVENKSEYQLELLETSFKTVTPYIDVKFDNTSSAEEYGKPEIVGFIIDKVEHLNDGSVKEHKQIIIENPKVTQSADFSVKYDAKYTYSIRTIVLFHVPAIDADTNEMALLDILVSSKSSNISFVHTIETIPPPAPVDLNFTWDYERINPSTSDIDPSSGQQILATGKPGSLLVHWAFPPSNSQRDIRKFQIFRRENIKKPFELIKVYDFDKSAIREEDKEQIPEVFIEYLSSPATFMFDDDFTRDSRYIYAVASIDAHGMTSGYSAQFEIWFDVFKNRIEKKLISHSGAPKHYPNLYLEQDLFVDTMNISGKHTRTMNIYFNPEFYSLFNDKKTNVKLLETDKTAGSYKLQFINLDLQLSDTIDINITDKRSAR